MCLYLYSTPPPWLTRSHWGKLDARALVSRRRPDHTKPLLAWGLACETTRERDVWCRCGGISHDLTNVRDWGRYFFLLWEACALFWPIPWNGICYEYYEVDRRKQGLLPAPSLQQAYVSFHLLNSTWRSWEVFVWIGWRVSVRSHSLDRDTTHLFLFTLLVLKKNALAAFCNKGQPSFFACATFVSTGQPI